MAHKFDSSKLPTTTHEFFHSVIALLTASGLAEAVGCSTPSAYKLAEDPDLSSAPVRNHLDRLKSVIKRLDQIEQRELAAAGIQLLADVIDMKLVPKTAATPDQDSVEGELLDDLPHLVSLHDAIRDGLSLVEIERRAAKAVNEIHEDVAIYKNNRDK